MTTMRRTRPAFFLTLAGVLITFPLPASAQTAPAQTQTPHPWSLNSAASVEEGKYGTGDSTTVIQFSENLKYTGETGEVGVLVPYLIRNGGGTIPGESRRATTGGIPNHANGVGDVQLQGKYFLLSETDDRPAVDLTGRVKIPTASVSDGLGTGRVDAGFGTELMKRLGDFITTGGVELFVRDRPKGSSIKPVRLNYFGGVGYPFTERFTAFVTLEGSTQSSSGVAAPLELVFSGVYKFTDTLSLNGFLLAGLTDGSPDFGGGAGVKVKF